MIRGYARVSTRSQDLERQVRNILNDYPNAKIYSDKFTATTLYRPNFQKLMREVKTGDSIVFDSVSRMSRDAEDGYNCYMKLLEMGVELIFLKEPSINTSVYKNAVENQIPRTGTNADYILEGVEKFLAELRKEQIKLAFAVAQKENDDRRQNIKEGMQTAINSGKHIGIEKGTKLTTKKSVKAKSEIQRLSKDFDGNLNDTDCMKLVGVSRNSYYKYKTELKNELY